MKEELDPTGSNACDMRQETFADSVDLTNPKRLDHADVKSSLLDSKYQLDNLN